jgi:hypothetical protein
MKMLLSFILFVSLLSGAVVQTQLTFDGHNVIAYYDAPAYSAVRDEIFYGHADDAAPVQFRPWVMKADGTGKREVAAVTMADPWGWSPDGTWLYMRKGGGLTKMNPDTGVNALVIPGVLSGSLCQFGSAVYAAYEVTTDPDAINVWKSVDNGDTFTLYQRHVLTDPYQGAGMHRLRMACYDPDSDGDPDIFYYKREVGAKGSYIFNARISQSIPFGVPDLGHEHFSWSGRQITGQFYVNCLWDAPLECGTQQFWRAYNAWFDGTLNVLKWSNYNYRPFSYDDTKLIMARNVQTVQATYDDSLAVYDLVSKQIIAVAPWQFTGPSCGYWCTLTPQGPKPGWIIFRIGDCQNRPQIFSITY